MKEYKICIVLFLVVLIFISITPSAHGFSLIQELRKIIDSLLEQISVLQYRLKQLTSEGGNVDFHPSFPDVLYNEESISEEEMEKTNNYSDTLEDNSKIIAPKVLSPQKFYSDHIDIIWVDNSDNEIGFKIERGDGSCNNFSLIAETDANITSYTDTGLESGTNYCYRVGAYNDFGINYSVNFSLVTSPEGEIYSPASISNSNSTKISGNSKLTINFDSNYPDFSEIVSGKTYSLARVKLIASPIDYSLSRYDEIRIDTVIFNDLNYSFSGGSLIGEGNDLIDFKIYNESTGELIAGPVNIVNDNGESLIKFSNINPIMSPTINGNDNRYLILKAKANSWFPKQSDNYHRIGMFADIPIVAYNINSSELLTLNNGGLFIANRGQSNKIKIYPTKAYISTNFTPSSIPSIQHEIGRFTIANENNEGNYSLSIGTLRWAFRTNNLSEGTNHPEIKRKFTLYKDSISENNKLTEITIRCPANIDCLKNGYIDFANNLDGYRIYPSDIEVTLSSTKINAGSSRNFIIVGDTTIPKINNSIPAHLEISLGDEKNSISAVIWDRDSKYWGEPEGLPISNLISW